MVLQSLQKEHQRGIELHRLETARIMSYELIDAIRAGVPRDERLVYCSFRGDPSQNDTPDWAAKVYDDHTVFDSESNIYLCVMSSRASTNPKTGALEYRRRIAENFGHGLLLMIDDLGSGIGAKNPLSTIDALPPTALIETSPANFQALYLFDKPTTDRAKFDALIRAFITNKFISGNDPGMRGVNRVCRIPFGINGKAKYKNPDPWRVRMERFDPAARYSIDRIVDAFGLVLEIDRSVPMARLAPDDRKDMAQLWVANYAWLKSHGMIKRDHLNLAGWVDMICPWINQHTGGADSGAAIGKPSESNGYHGAFQCHHGHCVDRTWRDLSDWINEQQIEELTTANDRG